MLKIGKIWLNPQDAKFDDSIDSIQKKYQTKHQLTVVCEVDSPSNVNSLTIFHQFIVYHNQISLVFKLVSTTQGIIYTEQINNTKY